MDSEIPQVGSALNQARRAKRKGRHRKVMLLLRKAAFQEPDRAGLWNRYALSCLREGKLEEARKAFAQAIWLDRKKGNARRARITKALAQKAESGELCAS